MLANDGVAHRPHLVKQIRASSGEEERSPVENKPIFEVKMNPEHLDLIKRSMVAVTKPGGTAAQAGAGVPYVMAGKTGTAQVIGIKQGEKYIESQVQERHRDHAWFIAFAPVEKPRIALAVLVENGGHGSTTAAPIARKVLDYYLLGKIPKPIAVVTDEAAVNE